MLSSFRSLSFSIFLLFQLLFVSQLVTDVAAAPLPARGGKKNPKVGDVFAVKGKDLPNNGGGPARTANIPHPGIVLNKDPGTGKHQVAMVSNNLPGNGPRMPANQVHPQLKGEVSLVPQEVKKSALTRKFRNAGVTAQGMARLKNNIAAANPAPAPPRPPTPPPRAPTPPPPRVPTPPPAGGKK